MDALQCQKRQEKDAKWERELKCVLNDTGYTQIQRVANTLQGAIYNAVQRSTNSEVIIKATQKFLHKHSAALINNKLHPVKENIIKESIMLKTVTTGTNAPESIVKFIDLLQCENNYYLIQESGGSSLFDFILDAHSLFIAQGHLSITEWTKVVKTIFKQMIEAIQYIHTRGIIHYDISVENFVINDPQINVLENPKNPEEFEVKFDLNDIKVKLIDFGLAEHFKDGGFLTDKRCGKRNYQSPEITMKKNMFSGQKNDIWSLGIVLFMMLFGVHPWMVANSTDGSFNYVFKHNGKITKILKAYNKYNYIKKNKKVIDLFQSVFQFEEQRISIAQIRNHSWLK